MQAAFSGIVTGSVYALIALGYSIIYRTMRMGHFAQGDFYMFGAFVGCQLFTVWKLPVVAAFAGAMLVTSILMLIVERLTYRNLYSGSAMALLMATMGMQYIIQEIVKNIWGADNMKANNIFPSKVFQVGSLIVTLQDICILSICVVLMLALTWFMKNTKTGVAMNAVSMNRKAASLMGVRNNRIIMVTYVLSACMAAIAGTMMGPIYSVRYTMGTTFGNKAMTAAVMGGFGSLPGAMLGSIILGVVESLSNLYIGTKYRDIVAFVILVIVLFTKPQGLLGRKSTTKV